MAQICNRCKLPLVHGIKYCPHCGYHIEDKIDTSEIYRRIVAMISRSHAYLRHEYCRAKNYNVYLKVHFKQGEQLTPAEYKAIEQYITREVGNNRTIGLNNIKGTMTITLYT